MMQTIGNPWLWGGFIVVVIAALLIDLVLMRHGGPHKVTFKEALLWSIGWVALALAFMALLLLTATRNDLLDAWRRAVPADAPNRFAINIQPAQVAAGAHLAEGQQELRGDGDAAHIHVLHAPRDAHVHVEIGIARCLVPAGIQGFAGRVLVVEQREPGAGRQVGVVAGVDGDRVGSAGQRGGDQADLGFVQIGRDLHEDRHAAAVPAFWARATPWTPRFPSPATPMS